jgi:hypothetical protein
MALLVMLGCVRRAAGLASFVCHASRRRFGAAAARGGMVPALRAGSELRSRTVAHGVRKGTVACRAGWSGPTGTWGKRNSWVVEVGSACAPWLGPEALSFHLSRCYANSFLSR